MYTLSHMRASGFTLVELLVVIAVLGVLAAGVLVAINPPEQLARGRDSGRVSAITEMGRGLNRYYTAQASYPATGVGWITVLSTAGEVKIAPVNPSGSTCSGAVGALYQSATNKYCYNTGTVSGKTEFIVYASAESGTLKTKATCTSTQQAWIVYSSQTGSTGLMCTTDNTEANNPTVANAIAANIKSL